MALTVSLSAFYVCLKHLGGLQMVSSHENLRSNDSRRLYDAVDIRRTADTCRLSQGFRAKEPSVDPTWQLNMSVFCAEVFIVNWRADLRKYNKKFSYRRVSWNLASCQATVQKILVRQVLNKLWSWRVKVGRCVINMCTQPWRDRMASIVLWVS